jgi:hypothetical protein
MPKPPPIYITDNRNISPLIQLLDQIAKQQYVIKALEDKQVKVQPKTSKILQNNYKNYSREIHGIPHKQIKRRKTSQSSVKKCTNPNPE